MLFPFLKERVIQRLNAGGKCLKFVCPLMWGQKNTQAKLQRTSTQGSRGRWVRISRQFDYTKFHWSQNGPMKNEISISRAFQGYFESLERLSRSVSPNFTSVWLREFPLVIKRTNEKRDFDFQGFFESLQRLSTSVSSNFASVWLPESSLVTKRTNEKRDFDFQVFSGIFLKVYKGYRGRWVQISRWFHYLTLHWSQNGPMENEISISRAFQGACISGKRVNNV